MMASFMVILSQQISVKAHAPKARDAGTKILLSDDGKLHCGLLTRPSSAAH
jgi:hypothetical protein